MKKVFSMFLALMLFCSMTVTAMADSFQIGTDKDVINAGERLTITVNLDETLTGNFRNVQGQIKYDTDILTYVSHNMGEQYAHYSAKNIPAKSYFTFSNTDMTSEGFREIPHGTIAVIVFEADKTMTADHVTATLAFKMKVQDVKGVTEQTQQSASFVICKEHTWNSGEIMKAVTCESAGEIQYTCTYRGCGAVMSEQITELGHNLKDVAAKEATCTENGHEAGKSCSRCSYTEGQAVIKAGHELKDVAAKEATCTTDGHEAGKACNNCNYTEGLEVIKAGHDLEDVAAKEATCTTDGHEAGKSCSNCNYTEGLEVIKAGHDLKDVAKVEATCTTDGHEAGKSCSNCNYTEGLEVIKAGHDLKDVAKVEATCTTDGHEAGKSCSNCNYTEGLEVIKAGHEWTAATCVASKTCAVCKDTEGKPLGHKYGAYKVTKKATFGKAGAQTSTCSNCKGKQTKTIKAAAAPKLSAAAYTFNNKAKTPSVKLSGVSSKYYTVTYAKGRKAVGTYKVTVTLKGAYYSGSKTLTFKINPAAPSGVKLTKGKKQFKASWKKPSATYRNQIDGYQIRYATSKAGLAKAKVYKAGSKTATAKTIKKLKSKKTYYVQIRTYNKVGKTTYYSGWTTAKTVKTK